MPVTQHVLESSPNPRYRLPLRFSVAAVTVTGTAAMALAAAPPASASQDLGHRYVALGDSFTSGPFIVPHEGDPALCLRSQSNYPSLVADRVGAETFVDVSCAGATTEGMTEPQDLGLGTENPPQFDALTEDTTLVTVGIGGNDFGFGDVSLKCAALSGTDPHGAPCQEYYTDGGGDELADRIARTGDEVAEVLSGIRERSPEATVAVVGYLQLLPEDEGCWPRVPFAEGDVGYLDSVQSDLNAALEAEAEEAGMSYVDVFERGHDMCADSSDRWVEGIFPDKPAAPIHPNELGMEETASSVLETLGTGATAPLP
ncbi:GDSL-like lipase/acylhydrolase family protein [Haloactinospora alba]|uniref:GDSL-like lipase/acylhydrolase family protein n=1 Tax=Haloactinospora alba TaxID=405555 RepID=A0A543NMS4_9ACTN|nr:SGNH/GDSL hydrolase family protein [Haloactinospora alba]TQN33138.1 GDSL-like lipase/acylhydrolase family protein [Haloactinospora alba]